MKRHVPDGREERIRAGIAALTAAPEDSAGALSDLCAAAKGKRAAGIIGEALRDRAPLYAALASPAPKVRKNAARLLGALGNPEDGPALLAALDREETRFVRPSMILALGAVGGNGAYEALLALPIPENEADKHDREEAAAIRAARARLAPAGKHPFTGLHRPMDVLLTAPPGMEGMLRDELTALGIRAGKAAKGGLWVRTDDPAGLYRARCFSELLIPLARNIALPQGDFQPEALAAAVAAAIRAPFLTFLTRCHGGEPPYAYRIECGERIDRGAFARALASRLDPSGEELVNAPSRYEWEIRVIPGQGSGDVFCRPFTLPDTRFAYRVHPISASMQPALAAAMARYSLRFTPDRPLRVLDPCCGSGTLLIERERLGMQAGMLPPESLLGLDIVGGTVEKARENCAAAGSRARILHKDCRGFAAREPVDLILSNLPFGMRVGTHEGNEALYAEIAARLPGWLAPDGAAILHTMEYRLLMKCIRAEKGLRILDTARTEAGGLMPWIVACGKR